MHQDRQQWEAASRELEAEKEGRWRRPIELLRRSDRDLYLRIADIVRESGTGFAFPSQTVYLASDAGPSESRSRAAEDKVNQWREAGDMPLPRFEPERVSELKGSIAYPPPGSSSGRQ